MIADLEALCVHPDYTRRGVASALTDMVLELGASGRGCGGANVMCTSDYTRAIMDKRGFREYDRLVWEDYREDGELLFPHVEFPSAVFMYKNL